MVVGDGRPFVAALVTLDDEFLGRWAAEHGKTGADLATLSSDPDLLAEVQKAVDGANRRLQGRVGKKFTVLDIDIQRGGGPPHPDPEDQAQHGGADFADESKRSTPRSAVRLPSRVRAGCWSGSGGDRLGPVGGVGLRCRAPGSCRPCCRAPVRVSYLGAAVCATHHALRSGHDPAHPSPPVTNPLPRRVVGEGRTLPRPTERPRRPSPYGARGLRERPPACGRRRRVRGRRR